MAASTHLTLKEIENELKEVTAADWYPLGIQLGLRPPKLKEIEQYNLRDTQRCKLDILDWWLQNAPVISWEELASAVEGMGGHSNVVQRLRKKMSQVPQVSVTQQTPPQGETDRLNSIAQGEEVAEVTHQNKRSISAKYATLLANVYSTLQQKGIDVREFLLFVVARFPPGDCIPHSGDLAEIFEAITRNRLWDFLNYQPLEDIVQHFGTDDEKIKDCMKEYKAHLAGFKACMKIVNYLSEVESDSSFDESDSEQPTLPKPARYDRRYYRKLSLKLKVKVTDQSLSYIDDIWRSVSEYLLLPPLSVLLDHICKGSLTLVWLIPTGLVPQSLKRIRQGSNFFQQNSIESVTLDDQCVYNEEASSVEQRQIIVDPHELLQACKQGDLEVVLQALAADVDVDIKDTGDRTPLILVSYSGQLDLISPLLLCGANVNAQDKKGWTPLLMASHYGDVRIVQLLLANQADVNVQTEEGGTALYIASQNNHVTIVQQLLQSGASVDKQTETGATALFVASQNNHVTIVQQLLQNGASVDIQKEDGFSPLHIASQEGHVDVCTLLIERGANLNSQTKDGATALYVASQNNHVTIVQQLLQSGASVDKQTEGGATALYIASQNNHMNIVQILLQSGASVDIQKENGWSPLMSASEHGHRKVATLLIEQGANLNLQNKNQDTALTIASYHGKVEVVKELLAAGAHTDFQANDGRTALALAGWNGHLSVVKELVAKGANPNIQDPEGLTALLLAIKQGHTEIVRELVHHGNADVNIQEESTGWTALFFAAKDGDLDLIRLLIQGGANVELKDKNGVTALDVARTFSYDSVCQELQSHMSRQHEQQKTTTETKELVKAARKFLQTMFSRVEKSILKTRSMKREMAGNQSHSTHERHKTISHQIT